MTRPHLFVISPISATRRGTSNSWKRILDECIRPAGHHFNYDVSRADNGYEPRTLTVDIIQQIINAEIVVVDVSDSVPNVLYELGLRHALSNNTITISRDLAVLPLILGMSLRSLTGILQPGGVNFRMRSFEQSMQ